MLKNRDLFVTICFLGFVAFLLFVGCILKDVHWSCLAPGDKATWTGSGVAFLALIAAVVAAVWSKRSSDIANENSTFLSLSNLSETKSEKVNSQLIKLREIMKTFHDKIREEKSAGLNVDGTCARCWQDIRQSSEEINQSFHIFKNKVNFSKISSESKDNLILYFLESIKTDLVWEFLSKYLTRYLFENAPVNFPPPEEIYKNYVDIATAMKEKNLHTDLFEKAELINGPYLRD